MQNSMTDNVRYRREPDDRATCAALACVVAHDEVRWNGWLI